MHLQYLITRPCSAHSIYNTALGSQEFVCSHKVCALKRLPRFRTLISEIVLLKIHYNEGLSPLSVLRSSALLKHEQVIKRMCLTLQWAQWHRITKQLLGKAFVTKGRLPLPGGVEEEDHFNNQTRSLSSFLWRGKTAANISHLCPAYILQLANMSKSLSGKLERKGVMLTMYVPTAFQGQIQTGKHQSVVPPLCHVSTMSILCVNGRGSVCTPRGRGNISSQQPLWLSLVFLFDLWKDYIMIGLWSSPVFLVICKPRGAGWPVQGHTAA